MLDIVLLFGRFVLLGLLYVFLFAAVRAGMGLVTAGAPASAPHALGLAVIAGPPELLGVKVPLTGSVTIGRAADADIVVGDEFVSSHHARVTADPASGVVAEDLGSTNGTILGGRQPERPTKVKPGDVLELGTVKLRVERL